MKLTKGEYCQFGLRSRMRLLKQFGALVCERRLRTIKVQVFRIYDFFVEVVYDLKTSAVVKAEPILNMTMTNFYKYLLPAGHRILTPGLR
jgi:hypothetical protein